MYDRDPLALLDDVGEHAQGGSNALVVPSAAGRGVNVHGSPASLPADVGRVDGVLHLVNGWDE